MSSVTEPNLEVKLLGGLNGFKSGEAVALQMASSPRNSRRVLFDGQGKRSAACLRTLLTAGPSNRRSFPGSQVSIRTHCCLLVVDSGTPLSTHKHSASQSESVAVAVILSVSVRAGTQSVPHVLRVSGKPFSYF